jgi:hypothetical protein
VSGAVAAPDVGEADTHNLYRDTMAEWAADPTIDEFVRVPNEVARKALFQPRSVLTELMGSAS